MNAYAPAKMITVAIILLIGLRSDVIFWHIVDWFVVLYCVVIVFAVTVV